MAHESRPTAARYRPHNGLAAIDPQAVGLEFLLAAPPVLAAPEGVACVHVCGPLAFGGFLFRTYASIREEVRCALASEAHTVVLVFDSPGGDVDGCFDCARGLRADAEVAGKRLVGWVPSKVCSAAYALATACERLVIASSAQVGSIGVIRELQSVARADAAAGVDFAYVVSGAKKALGNPHLPITEATLTEAQVHVDATARLFFELVEETRGVEPEALQAGLLMGAAAVERGLADEVSTYDALMLQLSAQGEARAGATQAKQAPMSAARVTSEQAAMPAPAKAEDKKDDEKKDDMRAQLKREAASDDPVTAKRAARALKAYDSDDEDEKKDDKAQAPAAAKAEGDDKPDEKKDDKAVAAAGALAAAVAQSDARIKALESQLAARDAKDQAAERAAFMAAHADLPAPLLASLEGLPLEQCKKIVASVPPAFRSQVPTLARVPAQGSTAGTASSETARAEFMNSPLAARMGAVATERVVRMDPTGHVQEFGVRRVKESK